MAIIPWILAVVIALAGAALHMSVSGRPAAHQAKLSEIQAQGEAHRATMIKEHEAALAPLLAETAELRERIAAAQPDEPDDSLADAGDSELATAELAAADGLAADVAGDTMTGEMAQADAAPMAPAAPMAAAAATPEAATSEKAATVSQFVPYTELLRLPIEALMDTDPRSTRRVDMRRLTAAADLFRERVAAKEADADTARAALAMLVIVEELHAAKERSRERFRAAAEAQPSTHSSNPRILEEMRLAAVDRAERNAEAEYARLVTAKKGQIGRLYQELRDGENAVQELIAKGPDAKRIEADPERKDLERQVARKEKALADLRSQVTDLQDR